MLTDIMNTGMLETGTGRQVEQQQRIHSVELICRSTVFRGQDCEVVHMKVGVRSEQRPVVSPA